jgi:outer membrane protein TolC
MITSTFELISAARDRLGAELQAANAKRDFYLAEADLTAAIYGGGAGASASTATAALASAGDADH